jgi:hypothetical protein
MIALIQTAVDYTPATGFPKSLGDVILVIAIALAVFLVIFLLFRWINLWYWKIDKIVTLLEDQNNKLDQLVKASRKSEDRSIGTPLDSNDPWICPKCQHTNPNSTFTCQSCGYSLV